MQFDPVVLKTTAVFILFGILFIPILHVLRKKLRIALEIAIIPAAIIGFLVIFASIYQLNLSAYMKDFDDVRVIVDKSIASIIFTAVVLFGGLALASILSSRLSKQSYRSLFHVITGSFFTSILIIDIHLAFLLVALTISVFCLGEYLRKCDDDSRLVVFSKKVLNPALRDGEFEGYIASIFFLISTLIVAYFLYPINIKYAVGAIAILTYADPSATLVGRRFGKHKWKSNPQKSIEGSTAMFFVAIFVLVAIDVLQGKTIDFTTAVIVAICVTLSESLPLKIGDNLIIPVLAGMVMLSGVSSLLVGLNPYFWLYIVPLFVFLGAFAYLTGMLDTLGTDAAAFFGILVFISAGYAFLISLLMFLVLGFMFTKFGYEYKKNLGAAEPGEGRRGVNPVVANGIIPTFTAVLYHFNPAVSITIFVGAVSAALADTAATELGVFHKNPVMMTTGERVKPGTRGAVSLLGEVAAIFGALAMGGVVITLLSMSSFAPVPAPLINPINLVFTAMVCGIVGCNIDSLLGASMPFLSKEEVNLMGTLAGAGVALVMMLL
jgi:uncharacterized protein (TIGR00297 family)